MPGDAVKVSAVVLVATIDGLLARFPEEARACGLPHGGEPLSELQGGNRGLATALESRLSPAKFLFGILPNFVVPIQRRWAEHLVDELQAESSLLGADTTLGLNREAVYYRADAPPHLSAPCRVLWYVSDDAVRERTRAIVACSHVDEVQRGDASSLYERYRHLGVYRWEDVSAASGSAGSLMALRFSRTETFPRSIPLGRARRLLDLSAATTFQGPRKVTDAAFGRVYREGARIG